MEINFSNEAMLGNTFPKRVYNWRGTRKSASRSRNGCVRCKTSRTKCDEGRPKCKRCTKAGTACTYVPVDKVPIADVDMPEAAPRTILPRMTPGIEVHDSIETPNVDGAWHRLNALLAPEGVGGAQLLRYANPYLPDKSQELLYYFQHAGVVSLAPMGRTSIRLSLPNINQPVAMQNVMIIAGLHFAWKSGALREFEPCFLLHRGHLIRAVNESIVRAHERHLAALIVQVATLCLAELCLADVQAATTHLNGIASLLDQLDLYRIAKSNCENDPEQEMADRYFILAHKCYMSFTAKLVQHSFHACTPHITDQSKLRRAQSKTAMFHRMETPSGGLSTKLEALRLVPSFINPLPPNAILDWIDAEEIIKALRSLTRGIDNAQGQSWQTKFDTVWAKGAAARVLELYTSTNTDSIKVEADKTPFIDRSRALATPYCAMFITTTAYLYSVVRIWDPLGIEPRIFHHLMLLLQRNLVEVIERVGGSSGSAGSELLFWQFFIAMLSIRYHDTESSSATFFAEALRRQSESLGLETWRDAEITLGSIVWTQAPKVDKAAQMLWEEICLN